MANQLLGRRPGPRCDGPAVRRWPGREAVPGAPRSKGFRVREAGDRFSRAGAGCLGQEGTPGHAGESLFAHGCGVPRPGGHPRSCWRSLFARGCEVPRPGGHPRSCWRSLFARGCGARRYVPTVRFARTFRRCCPTVRFAFVVRRFLWNAARLDVDRTRSVFTRVGLRYRSARASTRRAPLRPARLTFLHGPTGIVDWLIDNGPHAIHHRAVHRDPEDRRQPRFVIHEGTALRGPWDRSRLSSASCVRITRPRKRPIFFMPRRS